MMPSLALVLAVPARPASTAAARGAIGPHAAKLASSVQPSGANETLLNLFDMAYHAADKFGVDKCEEIEASDLSGGQTCEDYYSRQTLFMLCRSRDTSNPEACERGVNFTCWVPGISNLASAEQAGIRPVGASSDDASDAVEIGPWLVPPGKLPYPNGPDGQPAVYPEGKAPDKH